MSRIWIGVTFWSVKWTRTAAAYLNINLSVCIIKSKKAVLAKYVNDQYFISILLITFKLKFIVTTAVSSETTYVFGLGFSLNIVLSK